MRRSTRQVSSAYSWEPEPRSRLGFGRLFLATLVLAGGLELARRTLLVEAEPRTANPAVQSTSVHSTQATMQQTDATMQAAPALTRVGPAEMTSASKASANSKPSAILPQEPPTTPVTADPAPAIPKDATAQGESIAKPEPPQAQSRKAARTAKTKRRREVQQQQQQRVAPRRRAYDRHYADDYRALRQQEWPGAGMGYGFGYSNGY
jgi:hypothetical protein